MRPSQLRCQSTLSNFAASSHLSPLHDPTSLYRISLISPILRPAGDVKHNNRGCATIALSCPSFDAVQHRLAASPVLRFTCSLARPRPRLHILDLSFLQSNINPLGFKGPTEAGDISHLSKLDRSFPCPPWLLLPRQVGTLPTTQRSQNQRRWFVRMAQYQVSHLLQSHTVRVALRLWI